MEAYKVAGGALAGIGAIAALPPAVLFRKQYMELVAHQALEQYDDLPQGALLNNFHEQVLGFVGRHVGVDPARILEGFSFLSPP